MRAFSLNPLVTLSAPLLALYFLRFAAQQLRLLPVAPAKPIAPVFYYAVCTIIVLFWVLRNLPVYPFTLLAPH